MNKMNWRELEGKRVYLRLKNGRIYSGIVKEIDERSPPLVFISIIDKFSNLVVFVNSEVLEIREEKI